MTTTTPTELDLQKLAKERVGFESVAWRERGAAWAPRLAVPG